METATGEESHESHHRSRWPVVAAGGAAALYVGAAFYLLGAKTPAVPPLVGAGVFVLGVVGFVGGLAGWTVEAFLGSVGTASPRARRVYEATMVLFLGTDVATFAAGFVYYFFVRAGAWPPEHLPPLLGSLVLVNTLILIVSSVTLHYAHEALHDDRQRRFRALLGVTLLLGVVFVGGQALEYAEFLAEGFTLSSGIFASAFYGLTGLHGLHVSLGAVLLGIVFVRAMRGEYGSGRDASVRTVSLYWHFVDVVWVFLVVVLYVGASVQI